ncbi:MAG: hypothetical protein M3547_12380, partial [Acidobacteriota bacterium]|nr:hypothetical protein [Acidobacteriota bacterium]
HADALLESAMVSRTLASEFSGSVGSVELNSEPAERSRQYWRERTDRERARKARSRDGRAELGKALDVAGVARPDAWLAVAWALSISTSGDEPIGLPGDLLTAEGWISADSETRGRIVSAAKAFVKTYDPRTSEWLGTNQWPADVLAGIAAFSLLERVQPQELSEIGPESWARWAPALFTMPFFGHETDEAAGVLRLRAYRVAQGIVLDTLSTAIDAGDWSAIEKVNEIWDERLESVLVEKIRQSDVDDAIYSALLRKLLTHHSSAATKEAREILMKGLPLGEASQEKVIRTGVLLLETCPAETWPLIWPTLKSDDQFARRFFVALAREGRADPAKSTADEAQVADLYVRLCDLFPHEKDRRISGQVGPDDEGRMFRDSVLAELQSRGTEAACRAIESIAARLPSVEWLKWILLDAKTARRRNSPHWPSAETVFALAADKSRRFVRDAADLQNVILEALTALGRELQGETPAAEDLWGDDRPKPEGSLSNWLQRHLKRILGERGVVIGREVQIHLREKTDLHVDAVAPVRDEDFDTVSVIVEVKGCWNPGLLTDMKDQLVDKYLTDSETKFGIYLVFWFDCSVWNDADSRRRRRPWRKSMEELMIQLDAQAAQYPRVRALVLDARLKYSVTRRQEEVRSSYTSLAEKYRIAYGEDRGLGEEFDGWENEGAWPEK